LRVYRMVWEFWRRRRMTRRRRIHGMEEWKEGWVGGVCRHGEEVGGDFCPWRLKFQIRRSFFL
jgi:hypothetical protein